VGRSLPALPVPSRISSVRDFNQFLLENMASSFALFDGFAPTAAADVLLRVQGQLAAEGTVARDVVFKKLDQTAAVDARRVKDVLRFPIASILSWTHKICHNAS
jgi:hypothetical protein